MKRPKAFAACTAAADAAPNDVETAYRLGIAAFNTGHHEEALKRFQQVETGSMPGSFMLVEVSTTTTTSALARVCACAAWSAQQHHSNSAATAGPTPHAHTSI
jgi:hypothetical protein